MVACRDLGYKSLTKCYLSRGCGILEGGVGRGKVFPVKKR